jgi:hypothetical protein
MVSDPMVLGGLDSRGDGHSTVVNMEVSQEVVAVVSTVVVVAGNVNRRIFFAAC